MGRIVGHKDRGIRGSEEVCSETVKERYTRSMKLIRGFAWALLCIVVSSYPPMQEEISVGLDLVGCLAKTPSHGGRTTGLRELGGIRLEKPTRAMLLG